MPSSLIVPIVQIKNLRKHPDADKLDICNVLGWSIVTGRDLYKEDEVVAYIPPDSLVTETLAEELGILQHLSTVKNMDGTFVTNEEGVKMLRVRQAKLRGFPSFGTTVPSTLFEKYGIPLDTPVGENVADKLKILKFEPHLRTTAGDATEEHPLFVKYISIENLRHYPKVLEEGEAICVSEKINGTNSRVGIIEGEFMAGSHSVRRKEPTSVDDYAKNTYWFPLSLIEVKDLLNHLYLKGHKQVILFGEIYGNVQKKYNYDVKSGIGFRAFDLLVDGTYLDEPEFKDLCLKHGVKTVPTFNYMAYNYKNVTDCVETISGHSQLNFDHPMEGVVIKPIKERHNFRVGRLVLKYCADIYLLDTKKQDFLDF